MPQKLHCYTCDNCSKVLWYGLTHDDSHYSYKDMAFCDDKCYEVWENQGEPLERTKVSGSGADKINED